MSNQQIILASASPRRQELLTQIGVNYRVASQDIDETPRAGEAPHDYVQRMANDKAGSAIRGLGEDGQCVVLGADTIVVCDEQILGKPRDKADAVEMLLKLSAREHHVLSAVTVGTQTERYRAVSDSSVQFRVISPEEAECYWRTGEPAGKAGAYAIQGRAAEFVKHLAGSYSGVMGLPLFETAQLLSRFGIGGLPLTLQQ